MGKETGICVLKVKSFTELDLNGISQGFFFNQFCTQKKVILR